MDVFLRGLSNELLVAFILLAGVAISLIVVGVRAIRKHINARTLTSSMSELVDRKLAAKNTKKLYDMEDAQRNLHNEELQDWDDELHRQSPWVLLAKWRGNENKDNRGNRDA